MSSDRLRHLPGLDGLRGLAVVAVIAFHAGHLRGGYLGVDLFFTLSGFLITSLLLAERQHTGTISLARFWERRLRRLLPAVLVLLMAVAAYAAWWAEPLELPALRRDGLATLFYLANWRAILSHASYWTNYSAPSPLHHMWSLAIEEQFYVLWPGLVLLVLRRGAPQLRNRRLLVACVAGALASWAWMANLYEPGRDTSRIYYGTDTRIGAILAGAALAAFCAHRPLLRRDAAVRVLDLAAALALSALAVAWLVVDGQSGFLYRGGFALCALAAVVIIAAVALPAQPGVVAQVLSWKPLTAAGQVSYGLYLWHWPVFVWMTRSTTGIDDERLLLAAQLTVTVLITLASYWFLEQPIRRRRWLVGPRAPLAAPLAMAAVAVVLLAGTVTTGSTRNPVLADGLGSAATVPTDGGGSRPKRVLLAGDSVGASLATGLRNLPDLSVELHSLARVGCGVNTEFDQIRLPDGTLMPEDRSCIGWPERWRDEVAATAPDVRILVLGWPGQTARFLEGSWRLPCDPHFDRWYHDRVVDALRILHKGATSDDVVAITTAPYYRPPDGDEPPDNDQHVRCLNETYRAAAADVGSTEVIDLAGWVCPSADTCRERDNGTLLRADGLHFLGPAGGIAGSWVVREALDARRVTRTGG